MVRTLERADVPRAADVLASAFLTEPLSLWLFGPENLHERLRKSFQVLMRVVYQPKGSSYTTDDVAGAALWSAPGKYKMSIVEQIRVAPGYIRLMGASRIGRAARTWAEVEKHHPDEPHWHLGILGVDPSRQRTGVGSSLLRPVLDRCDDERTLAHLETALIENVAYYKRFGFEVVAEFDAPPDGPHMWFMTRKPL